MHSHPNSDFSLKCELFAPDFGADSLEFLETISMSDVSRTRLVKCRIDSKYYALKSSKKYALVSTNQTQHALNEVQILSRLRCCFVPELYSVFQDENTLFLLLEYVPGGELFSHLRRRGVFDFAMYQFYATEIACALKYLHNLNILYRGLKPENIAITRSGHIRLIDFSYSKIFEERKTFTLCGTPEYCAPEILLGTGYGKSSDWWAFGVLIYEMSCGYSCFMGDSPFVIYNKIAAARVNFPRSLPRSTRNIIRSLLIKDRRFRLGKCHENILHFSAVLGCFEGWI